MFKIEQIEDLRNWKHELEEKKRSAENELAHLRKEVDRLQFRMKIAQDMAASQHQLAVERETTSAFQLAQGKLESNQMRLMNDIAYFETQIAEINKLLN